MLQDRTTQRHCRLFKRGLFSRILHFDGVRLCADVGIKWCWYGQECAVSDLSSVSGARHLWVLLIACLERLLKERVLTDRYYDFLSI
ncbi:hypothetical protein XfCFBP8082_09880 [Xylella fastidiosa subsp. fastidiosa]|jgi:hypothetical protein|nr:hypothetical protein XFEB_02178 [Xylella fastidiosa EB92.1]NBI38568.1 hypothetical protein [Xylella fastidiosa subsp. fastidiosa]QIS26148.1 hypothetical protein F7G16_08140 [Xylella fastidiosa]RUA36823.1 hypothetical protein DX878_07405 [Xylella fastidiosa subsp. fastidiosa]RUA37541.1 hypothetical protein DX877_05500 [Xylella fastidiosa subsp. fastidiosa]